MVADTLFKIVARKKRGMKKKEEGQDRIVSACASVYSPTTSASPAA